MKMALIKCLSERRPSVDGLRLELGQEMEVSVEDAELLTKLGFAEYVSNRNDVGTGRKADSQPKPRRKRTVKGQPKTS